MTLRPQSAKTLFRLLTRLSPGIVVASLLMFLKLNVEGAPNPAEKNWPQWRGPLGTGTAPLADPPVKWSESQNVKWKVKIPGRGTATPIIWENKVFIQTAMPVSRSRASVEGERSSAHSTGSGLSAGEFVFVTQRRRGFGGMRVEQPSEPYQFLLMCLDRETGKTLWQKVARQEVPHEGHHPDHGFASHSPVTDGKHVYAYFGSRGLHCFDMQGKLKWSKDFGDMQTRNSFGEGSSPALFGNTIVVNWDHEGDDFIVAVDKETGKERWRQPREEDTTWATPIVVQHGGKAQVVTSATTIRAYDLASGKLLWQCGGMTSNPIPTPVAGNGMVYATSGFRGNALFAIRLGRSGDLTGSNAIAWSANRNTPYVPSPLLYGDKLYLFSGNMGILSCFNAKSGQPIINAERLDGMQGVYASPVAANGKVYLLGRNGGAVVIKASNKLETLATNQLNERFDASPAIAGKQLFLRGHEYLYCLASK